MALKKASLACAVCSSKEITQSKLVGNPKPTRLEVNKFCKHCGKYTTHRETDRRERWILLRDIFKLLKKRNNVANSQRKAGEIFALLWNTQPSLWSSFTF